VAVPTLRRPRRDMAALDRLEWPARLAIVRYGVRVGLCATDARLLDGVEDYLPPGFRPCRLREVDCLFSLRRTPSGEVPVETELCRDGEPLVRTDVRDVVLLALESAVRFQVALRTRQRGAE